ncbi:HEAT repeat domain-containing protein [Halococcus dombrowskii]|uniref:HEAT repeat domain-containing protein n=1 Tax=Halococcus dombrowskii TaxID=179637 RepID=A0AAX3ALZ0_HALDO|nr:HEAT repeat domain-containing protein [Halococcus dombrowskii]UOO94666.1 HEAT repeat domain-containing protein [Halococcus dombrowskii]
MDDTEPASSLRGAIDDALERGDGEELAKLVGSLSSVSGETCKTCLRRLKAAVADDPDLVGPALPACEALLTDDERSVRLTTAKLFAAAAEIDPDSVVPMVSVLAGRLADDEEFYYVRARSAEALGYVALDHPDTVATPELLADLRIGLSFDEPEVKEKLAKALEHVALGDPERLAHHSSALAEHCDDESELVRYHLCTALVIVGCEQPERLSDMTDVLQNRLTDENPYVRGRAAEGIALLAQSSMAIDSMPDLDRIDSVDDPPSFLVDRVRFARRALDGERPATAPGALGTLDSVRDGTGEIVAEITSLDADGECPHCGLELPESGPPVCPRCGAPH